jgi:hypothetical protein
MKVTNWRRKLMASLVAGGLMAPSAVCAANLDTNLVVNGGFESVDFGVTGAYGAPMILNWSGGPAFAYSHNPGVTGIPDYADGPDPPGAGNWYFSSNNNPGSPTGDWRAPGLVYQDIDVSTGATGTQIAIGEAAYKLSAWMSSYLNDNDAGNVQVDFRNSTGATISSALISDPDFGPDNVWSLTSQVGLVPVGTSSIRVSIFGTPRNGGADGYIDNVDVQLAAAANELMFLQVNTTNGQVSIKNQTGETVHIDYYEITSSTPALNATAWNSLQEQNLPGFPAGNGTGNGWEQFGGSSSTVIGESYLTGTSGVANNTTIGLGAAFNVGSAQNLVFRYGEVSGGAAAPDGDYNGDNMVDAADYVLWRKNPAAFGGDPAGYTTWRANFGATGGPSGPSTLIQGFVRYVTSGSGSAVPEPGTVLLIGIGLVSLPLAVRWRTRER